MNDKMKKIILVVTSNIFSVIIGITLGILIPKILSIPEYREYKVYTFYISFISLFHFGLNDGILIKYSRYSKKDLVNDEKIGFLLVLQFILSFIITLILLTINLYYGSFSTYTLIFISIIPLVFYTLFLTILKVNLRIKLYSLYTFAQKGIVLVVIILFMYAPITIKELVLGSDINLSHNIIIFSTIIVEMLLVIYAVIDYREIIFKSFKFKKAIKEYLSIICIGFPALAAYLISTLATGLDKIFIEFNNSVSEYAYYAFAFSMLQVVITVISSASTVVLPMLSRSAHDTVKSSYIFLTKLINVLTILASLGLVFVPWFLATFLPNYRDSAIIFFICFPIVLYSVQYSMKQRQFFLLLQKVKLNLILNLVVLIVVLILNIFVLLLNLDYYYYAIATIVAYIAWNLLIERYFMKLYRINLSKDVVFTIFGTGLILVYAYNFNNLIFSFMFILLNILLIIIFYGKFIFELMKKGKKVI